MAEKVNNENVKKENLESIKTENNERVANIDLITDRFDLPSDGSDANNNGDLNYVVSPNSGDYIPLSDETLFKTPLSVQRFSGGISEEGKKYYNYLVAFKTKIRGEEVPMKFFVVPPQSTGEMYNLASQAFGDEERKPLDFARIVTINSRNGKSVENIRYEMRVSFLDDFGSPFHCKFQPRSAGDRAMFQNLVNVLKARDIIK